MPDSSRPDIIAGLRRSFQHHDVDADAQLAIQRVRDAALQLALLIETLAPAGRERALALTQLEQAVMSPADHTLRPVEPGEWEEL